MNTATHNWFPRSPDSPAFLTAVGTVSVGQLLAHASVLAEQLPDRPYIINYCEDRYEFTVAFLAAAIRGQCNVLLPGHTAGLLAGAAGDFPEAAVIASSADVGTGLTVVQVPPLPDTDGATLNTSLPGGAPLLAVVYTSGTTGNSQKLSKSAGELLSAAAINAGQYKKMVGSSASLSCVLATVPPWHMYGLEWSVLLPLFADVISYSGSTLFSGDIQAARERIDCPVTLVSTPHHLRAFSRAGMNFSNIAHVISATAPLPDDLAELLDEQIPGSVHEVYGCSEAGSIAMASPAPANFRCFSGFSLVCDDGVGTISANHLEAPVRLSDRLEQYSDGSFSVLGRDRDMVKIAGKRGSLSELNRCLLAIEGVEDGVIFQPAENERLAGLVVAPNLSSKDILDAFSEVVEQSFVPRRVAIVESLPRNETGKLQRGELLRLFRQVRR